MKAKIIAFSLLVLAVVIPARAISTIAQWTFESSQPTTAGPIQSEVGSGSAKGMHINSATWSNPTGNGSSESWSASNWSQEDYWQFQTTTVGFRDVALSWDQASSATGPRDFGLFWSTDGSKFTQFGVNYSILLNPSSPSTWNAATANPQYTISYDLSSILDLNNTANVYFRLVDQSTVNVNTGSVGSSGSSRVDNFKISGTELKKSDPSSVPESPLSWFAGLSLLGVLALARRYAVQPARASCLPR